MVAVVELGFRFFGFGWYEGRNDFSDSTGFCGFWPLCHRRIKESSIKGEVKKKHDCAGWSFLASQPTYLSKTCFAFPRRFSARLVFSTGGFHCLFATRPVSSETSKQNGDQMATMVLFGTRGPQLFLIIREGLGSGVRLRARGTQ